MNLPSIADNDKSLFASLCRKESKLALIKQYGRLTLPAIVANQPATIGQLRRTYSAAVVEQCVGMLVHDLNQTFNNDLTTDNIDEIVAECTNGLMLNASLELVYLGCRIIKISDQFGKLSVNKVMKVLQQQLDDYSNAIADHNFNKHLGTKFVAERHSEKVAKARHIANLIHENNQNNPK